MLDDSIVIGHRFDPRPKLVSPELGVHQSLRLEKNGLKSVVDFSQGSSLDLCQTVVYPMRS